MKKRLLVLPLLFLYGCGGGSSSSSSGVPSEVIMEPGITYTVYKGDQILKTSEQASVRITHVDGSLESTVTLLDGNATIKHN